MPDHQPNSARAKILICGLCTAVVLTGAAAFMLSRRPVGERLTPPVRDAVGPPPSPSLHCIFSDFTHASAVAGFDFVVDLPKAAPPRFAERAEALRNDPAINFEAGARPGWAYSLDEDGTPTIASPDGATRILLYGLKLDSRDAVWIEAGVRSNTLRNLDGKCLQAHFDAVGRQDAKASAAP